MAGLTSYNRTQADDSGIFAAQGQFLCSHGNFTVNSLNLLTTMA
jgi:hypothetical protein